MCLKVRAAYGTREGVLAVVGGVERRRKRRKKKKTRRGERCKYSCNKGASVI